MMKVARILICVFTASMLVSSCSFEKRLYTKGYHIDWVSKNHKTENSTEAQTIRPSATEHDSFNETGPAVAIKSSTTQETFSPINIIKPTENNTSALASEKIIVPPSTTVNRTVEVARPETKVSASDVLPKNKRLLKKLIRRGADDTVLYVILALLIPPLAMFLYEGENWTDRCTLNLILTLLCWLPGVIHAVFVILDNR
ncbi:MAG: YqaE/Pmp3 family membrane protein [Bacteroidota bacterium]